MRASSPPLAVFTAPLSGMDAREIRPPQSPNVLFNIDLSYPGIWRTRPGVEVLVDGGGWAGNIKIIGLHTVRLNGELLLIAIGARPATASIILRIYDAMGTQLAAPAALPSEPYSDTRYYVFETVGKFIYFSNGIGSLWELEIKGGSYADPTAAAPPPMIIDVSLKRAEMEAGVSPTTMSYINGGLQPSSMRFFYDQLVLTGFLSSNNLPLTNPVENVDTNHPPKQLLSLAGTLMTVNPSLMVLSEPHLQKSFPVEDPGGTYWVMNESIIATENIATTLFVFTDKSVWAIIGHGSDAPRRIWLADITLVGSRALVRFQSMIFFVATDGCYLITGEGPPTKVSYEMDPLWFGRDEPEITRRNARLLRPTTHPFHVNLDRLIGCVCGNDRAREQVMIALPSKDSENNSMVWVWNYGDMLRQSGGPKWSIWGGGTEPSYQGTTLTPGAPTGGAPQAAPVRTVSPKNYFHWTAISTDYHEGKQRIYVGTDLGDILIFGDNKTDVDRGGVISTVPYLIGLGRVAHVDSDGRIVCTDVAVRRKQTQRNVNDDVTSCAMVATVRSEGEGLKYFDASEIDVEFSQVTDNMQSGVSENTVSVLHAITLGSEPTGTSSPLLSSEYVESYARVNAPDEEGRAVYVDLYGSSGRPADLHITEVRIYGSVKGGSQRQA